MPGCDVTDMNTEAHEWIGFVVRFVCGAAIGVFVGLSWMWWLSPVDNPAGGWGGFAGAVVFWAILAAKYGDTFWTGILRWFG